MKIILRDRFQQPWYLYHSKMAIRELLLFFKNYQLNLTPSISFAILAMIISLFVINFEKIVSTRQNFDYSVSFYFTKDLSEAELATFKQDITKFLQPTSIYYSSKGDTLKELYQLINISLDPKDESSQSLPSYIKVNYEKDEEINIDELNSFFTKDSSLEKIIASGEYLEKLNSLIKKVIYIFIGMVFLLLSSIIISYTNSLKIFFLTERKKLTLYYLIGTQTKFIKIPICYRAFWQGIFGGILGVLAGIFLSNQLTSILSEFTSIRADYLSMGDILSDKIAFVPYTIGGLGIFSFLLVNYLIEFLYKKYQYNYW